MALLACVVGSLKDELYKLITFLTKKTVIRCSWKVILKLFTTFIATVIILDFSAILGFLASLFL
jgi:hypothetical protein